MHNIGVNRLISYFCSTISILFIKRYGNIYQLIQKNTEENSSKNVEDFVSLTRVYFQSVIAANLGITNIRFVPDVANFKRLFKIPTQGGRLGQAEKQLRRRC